MQLICRSLAEVEYYIKYIQTVRDAERDARETEHTVILIEGCTLEASVNNSNTVSQLISCTVVSLKSGIRKCEHDNCMPRASCFGCAVCEG